MERYVPSMNVKAGTVERVALYHIGLEASVYTSGVISYIHGPSRVGFNHE